jgi:hypothetical protein
MEVIISSYHHAENSFVISPSDQAQTVGHEGKFEKRFLHHNQPNYLLVPLYLNPRHHALAVVLIQPLSWPDWPGCVFFAVAISQIYVSCENIDVVPTVRETVGRIIDRFYPQVTVDVSKVPCSTQVLQFQALK